MRTKKLPHKKSNYIQKELFHSFFVDFHMLETAFLTSETGQTALLYKQNGDYVDVNNFERLFPHHMTAVTGDQMKWCRGKV